MCGWQKMTSVRFSVWFCKKCGFWFSFGFTKLTAVSFFSVRLGLHSSVDVDTIFHLHFYGMTLVMSHFRAELVQLTVSQSDSELEMQRHGMKKNTFTVDPITLQDELWMRQCEKPSPNRRSHFFWKSNREFSFPEFWGQFGLVQFLENRYPTFSSGSTHPYNMSNIIETLSHTNYHLRCGVTHP